MAQKSRGQQLTLRVAIGDKGPRSGSMLKVNDWTVTYRTDLNEDEYLGENETDIDIQHNGFDFSFSVDTTDDEALKIADEIIAAEQNHEEHPQITITSVLVFRTPGKRSRMNVYHECFLKIDEEGSGGRKEKYRVQFSGKAKRRVPLNV